MDDAAKDMIKGAADAKAGKAHPEDADEALVSIAMDERDDIIPKKQ